MRLGIRPTVFQPSSEWSKLQLYGEAPEILERHRHRYEINPEYIERLEAGGLNFVGRGDKGERMEVVELKDHPWFVGDQFTQSTCLGSWIPLSPIMGSWRLVPGDWKRCWRERQRRFLRGAS